MRYEIRKIDAMKFDGEGWRWNTSYPIGEFKTTATDHKRAFLYAIHKLGYVCKRGKMAVVSVNNTYEIKDRRTGQPLFAAIPVSVA